MLHVCNSSEQPRTIGSTALHQRTKLATTSIDGARDLEARISIYTRATPSSSQEQPCSTMPPRETTTSAHVLAEKRNHHYCTIRVCERRLLCASRQDCHGCTFIFAATFMAAPCSNAKSPHSIPQ
ncbi:hypothetical protein DEO72_LG1g3068 [Vigna unguiculata]|uniref:Uncharacterized protein n=1 Tax=Vigna unguiculata TaxID=3917 RepID=A0A4D6KU98_VIGUN|nr:hypothetical protein DEO72_LG1g3068 [Vigna unguiculata]